MKLFTFLLLPTIVSAGFSTIFDAFDEISERLECPDPVEFSEEYNITLSCVENSIPPWPLCLLHNVTYFIQASISSSNRCCDFTNLEACRCPFKEHPMFQEKMEGWCDNIETCPDLGPAPEALSTDSWVSQMMTEVSIFYNDSFIPFH